jgi:uncharacterized protein (TIGR02246 family)
MFRLSLFAASLVLVAGSAFAQDKATIQALNDRFTAAFNRADPAAMAAMYTEDAYVLPAGADMVKGRGAIEAFWRGAIQQLGDAKLTTVDVLPLGSGAAREIGTFSFKTKGPSPQEVVGKYVVVWHNVDGQWKLATDIWNMNK